MSTSQQKYKRIVVKVGSSILYPGTKGINSSAFENISNQITQLRGKGKEIVVVSSGAIALGMHRLGLQERPKDLSYLQAIASIGQNELMDTYSDSLRKQGFLAGQILLTWEDVSDRRRYLNARHTVLTLLKLGVVPVINENDTVSVDEIKFGDNDRLSALVASLISADLLIILSDVEGLLDKDKKTVIRVVDKITPQIKDLACPTQKKTCVGGMVTKLEAAKVCVNSGIPCVIANGHKKDTILKVVDNPLNAGTLFVPDKSFLKAKKQWLAFGSKPKGRIIIDEGAKQALLNKKSLLCVGVTDLEGHFESGDIVSVNGQDNVEFARCKANISSKQLEKIKGTKYPKEAAHCDNIVVL